MMQLNNFFQPWTMIGPKPIFFPLFGILLFLVAIWSIVWKGMALWRAAHLEQKGWFVVLLVVNTLGILEILYLYVFSVKQVNQEKDKDVPV